VSLSNFRDKSSLAQWGNLRRLNLDFVLSKITVMTDDRLTPVPVAAVGVRTWALDPRVLDPWSESQMLLVTHF
jgi:hypothetical protein